MKIYMTVDSKGNPIPFGNCRKFAWKSLRWINYHIGSRRGDDSWFVKKGGQVKVVDLKTNTIESFSAKSFLIMNGNQDSFKRECIEQLGFGADPQTLINMLNANLLNPVTSERVVTLLRNNQLI